MSVILDDDQAMPLGNEPVYRDGVIIGMTTSAAIGYRIGKPVALAMIDTSRLAGTGNRSLEVDIAGARYSGSMTPGAAFDPQGTRMRSPLG